MTPIPNGSSPEIVRQFYDWLFQQYYLQMPAPRVEWAWFQFFLICGWGLGIVVFFVLYTLSFRNSRRKHDFYPGSNFGGIIMERVGPLTAFTIYNLLLLFLWGLFYVVWNIVFGLVY